MSAQDLYMRALLGPRALQDEQDRSLLWDEFLVVRQTCVDASVSIVSHPFSRPDDEKIQPEFDHGGAPGSG